MSAATMFRPGGDLYDCVPRIIDDLEPGKQHAATKVLRYLIQREMDGLLDERVTDRAIADAIGYSTRFVQKGLNALHVKLGELGSAIIDRMPSHGRRIITFVRGLAARREATPRAAPSPPRTPPEELKTKRETFTDTPPSSSSSPEIIIPKTNPDDPAFTALVARACGLIADATAERVGVTIATYGAEWVGRAWTRWRAATGNPASSRCVAGGTCWGSWGTGDARAVRQPRRRRPPLPRRSAVLLRSRRRPRV